MQFSTLVIAGIAAAASVIATPVIEARELKWCGNQQYDTNDYTCWDGFLCPKVKGVTYYRCGDACYNPSDYVCVDGYFLCPSTDPRKCGKACYNPAKYKCTNGVLGPR